jgi:hypothetical protein
MKDVLCWKSYSLILRLMTSLSSVCLFISFLNSSFLLSFLRFHIHPLHHPFILSFLSSTLFSFILVCFPHVFFWIYSYDRTPIYLFCLLFFLNLISLYHFFVYYPSHLFIFLTFSLPIRSHLTVKILSWFIYTMKNVPCWKSYSLVLRLMTSLSSVSLFISVLLKSSFLLSFLRFHIHPFILSF